MSRSWAIAYAYYQNRWVRNSLDSDGNGDADSSTIFIYDVGESLAGGPSSSPLPLGEGPGVRAGQILLQLDHPGTGVATAADLTHRYLWGPAVDQLLADETITSLETPGTLLWPLGDHLNTLRDLATYDTQTDTTTISNHRVFDAFGVLRSQTNSSTACLFAFTARPLDPDTLLQNNLNRWYDLAAGRWMSEDPIGYKGSVNVYEYVDSNPTVSLDPLGLLSWDDFQGTPPASSPLDASIKVDLTTNPKVTSIKCWKHSEEWCKSFGLDCCECYKCAATGNLNAKATMNKKASWTKTDSAALLKHEEIHLLIYQKTATLANNYMLNYVALSNMFCKKANAEADAKKHWLNKAASLKAKFILKSSAISGAYDSETNHGKHVLAQTDWEVNWEEFVEDAW